MKIQNNLLINTIKRIKNKKSSKFGVSNTPPQLGGYLDAVCSSSEKVDVSVVSVLHRRTFVHGDRIAIKPIGKECEHKEHTDALFDEIVGGKNRHWFQR